MSLIDTAKAYARGSELLFEWLGNGVPVFKELAEKRASTCAACSKNDKGYKPVEAVSSSVKELMAFKSHLTLETSLDSKLATCAICLCPTATKVWVDVDRLLRYSDEDELKQFEAVNCWITKERDGVQYQVSV